MTWFDPELITQKMTDGHLLLQGGSEFQGQMAASDLEAIKLSGGPDASICILPTAAALDNNHERAGSNGLTWFNGLGAQNTRVVMLINRISADDEGIVKELDSADFIYFLGGFPDYLFDAICGSKAWQTIMERYHNGSLIGGSSAGAMVLCDNYYSPVKGEIRNGLGLLPGTLTLPHHDTFGRAWVDPIQKMRPDLMLIGIDEQTGILNDGPGNKWSVHGRGGVTIYTPNSRCGHPAGSCFAL